MRGAVAVHHFASSLCFPSFGRFRRGISFLPGGEVLLGIFDGGVPPASPNPDPIPDQKMPFSTPATDLASKIHTRFQTCRCTWLSIAYASVLNGSQRTKMNRYWNVAGMIYFIYFSFSLTSYSTRLLGRKISLKAFVNVPPITIPNFRPNCSKSIRVFRPKRLKNHTLWGGTYLYTWYRGVPPPWGFLQENYIRLLLMQPTKNLSSLSRTV